MSKSLALLIGALAASTTLACSGAAFAETMAGGSPIAMGSGYSSSDAPLGAPTEVRIDLTGQVTARCELITPPSAMSGLRLDRRGQDQAAFKIDCNAPFNLRVVSRSGGFAAIDPTPGIQTLKPYEVSVDVGTNAGRQTLGWCEASSLAANGAGDCAFAGNSTSRGWSSGDEIAMNQSGSLRLRWDEQGAEAPLLGAYSDTIVIELEVRS